MITEREGKVILFVLIVAGIVLLWVFSSTFRGWGGEGVVVRAGIWKAHDTPIVRMALAPDDRTLATVGKDPIIKLWDLRSRTLLRSLTGHTDRLTTLAFSPDSSLLVSGSVDMTVRIWSVRDAKEVTRLSADRTTDWHSGWVESVAISPDGRVLATGSRDTTIKLWALPSGEPLGTLWGHQDTVTDIAFSKAEPRFLASSSTDGSIWIWDVQKKEPYLQLPPHGLNPQVIAFSPDGNYLATGGYSSVGVRLLNWRKAKLAVWCEGTVEGTVWDLTFSPDGRLIAAGAGDNGLWLWSSPSGKVIRTLKDDYWGDVRGVAVADGGKIVIAAFEDGTVRLWRITGLRIRVPTPRLPSIPGGDEHAH